MPGPEAQQPEPATVAAATVEEAVDRLLGPAPVPVESVDAGPPPDDRGLDEELYRTGPARIAGG